MAAAVELGLVCPACHALLESSADAYVCTACARRFPIVAGIPDLRMAPDPWIGLEEDRDKARRLVTLTDGMSFADSVRAYWSITPETPAALAARFTEHVLTAQSRSAEWLGTIAPPVRGTTVDLGCGTGDLLAAAHVAGHRVIGVDIALRWLVIARKRPEIENSQLICACAEALPFSDGRFAGATALGLLEHTRNADSVLRETRRVLEPGARFYGRTVNRYSLLVEPHVRVWGVGFVPRRWADRYVRWRSGQRYLHHRPSSARELRRGLRRAGFARRTVIAARLLGSEARRLGRWGRAAAGFYGHLRRIPVLSAMLTWFAPLLDLEGTVR